MNTPYWLFIFRQSPIAGRRAKEGLDTLLAAAAFDQKIKLIFWQDGVYQLDKGLDATGFGLAPVNKQLAALPIYGVEDIFASAEQLNTIDSILENIQPIDSTGMQQMIQRAHQVLVF